MLPEKGSENLSRMQTDNHEVDKNVLLLICLLGFLFFCWLGKLNILEARPLLCGQLGLIMSQVCALLL